MLHIRLLGSIHIESAKGTRADDAILAQPKAVALLAYLTVNRPKGLKRRDSLLPLLWSELDNGRARHALRQALYVLRRHLPTEAFRTRGTEEIGLNPECVTSDVWNLDLAIEQGDLERVAASYQGDLLSGFHVSGAAEFERWLEVERRRLRQASLDAVWHGIGGGGTTPSVAELQLARWTVNVDPLDERSVLGLIHLLIIAGNRAAARKVYREYVLRLHSDLAVDIDPAAAARVSRLFESTVDDEPVGAVSRPSSRGNLAGSDFVPTNPQTSRHRRWWSLAAAGVAVLAVGASIRVNRDHSLDLARERILVIPFTSHTGDASGAAFGTMAADWITQGLMITDFVQVYTRGTALADWQGVPPVADSDLGAVLTDVSEARRVGAGTMLAGDIFTSGDSLVAQARVIDAATGRVLETSAAIRFSERDPEPGLERLRDHVMAVVAARTDPRLATWIENAGPPSSYEAYRLFVQGLLAHVRDHRWQEATEFFIEAHRHDTTFAMAALWAVTASMNGGQRQLADSLLSALERKRTMLAPLDRHFLDAQRAHYDDDPYRDLYALRRVVQVAPGSDFLKMAGQRANQLNRPREALRYLEAIDPDYGWIQYWSPYWSYRINAHHLLGQWEDRRAVIREAARRFPDEPWLGGGGYEAVGHAALGFGDSALAAISNMEQRRVNNAWAPEIRAYYFATIEADAHGHPIVAARIADEGMKAYQRLAPTSGKRDLQNSQQFLIEILASRGHLDSARLVADDLVADLPERGVIRARLGVIAAAQGDTATALAVYDQLPTLANTRSLQHRWEGEILTQLGSHDEALAQLRLGHGIRPNWLQWHRSWAMAPLRDDPRFQELLQLLDPI